MKASKPNNRGLSRIGLALAALISIAAVATPASADDWNHRHSGHERHDGGRGHFSFGFGGPSYYGPPGYYYPGPRYYYPPPYYYPPQGYYAPGPSFNLVVPFGHRH